MKDNVLSWFFFQRYKIQSLHGHSSVIFNFNAQRTIGILDIKYIQCNKIIGKMEIDNNIRLN